MMIIKTIAMAGMSVMVNGIPLQANLIQGNVDGCEMSAQTARHWRTENNPVIERQIGAWCVTGRAMGGYWVSEQWWRGLSEDGKSRGWLVRIPLKRQNARGVGNFNARPDSWHLDIVDPELNTRFRYRQSLSTREIHHRKTLSQVASNALVMTWPHPDGGVYSVVVERGVKP